MGAFTPIRLGSVDVYLPDANQIRENIDVRHALNFGYLTLDDLILRLQIYISFNVSGGYHFVVASPTKWLTRCLYMIPINYESNIDVKHVLHFDLVNSSIQIRAGAVVQR